MSYPPLQGVAALADVAGRQISPLVQLVLHHAGPMRFANTEAIEFPYEGSESARIALIGIRLDDGYVDGVAIPALELEPGEVVRLGPGKLVLSFSPSHRPLYMALPT